MAYRYTTDVPGYQYDIERKRADSAEKLLKKWKGKHKALKAQNDQLRSDLAVAVYAIETALNMCQQPGQRAETAKALNIALAKIKGDNDGE